MEKGLCSSYTPIFAVKLFGFDPFAGFVALSIGTVGFFAKLLAEDINDAVI